MTIIYTGQPAPLNGKRRLTAREASQRAKAMACIRSPKTTQCQGQVHVGLFFDGTGNNDSWIQNGFTQTQRQRNKHSNVARLFDSHLDEPQNGFFRYYIPGVGTPFNDIGDSSEFEYGTAGMGTGYRGADRINYGIISIFNAVHRHLNHAALLNLNQTGALAAAISHDAMGPISIEGAMRWTGLTALEERLASVIQSHQRKVTQISVSIFGFSRGAAEARACAFWLSQICERHGGGMSLAGVPLRIGFLGIFDTVAAVGLGDAMPLTSGHMAWGNGTQSIHPAVEDCAHFIALHEQRASFPLEAAVGRGNIGYPGMHSDVGGGYAPGEQGKAMPEWGDSPHLSQIPLIDMHFAAIKAGVPMMTIEEIMGDPGLRKSFATDKRLLSTYNRWLEHQGIKGGDIREVTEAHTRHYIRWRAAQHLGGGPGISALNFFKRTRVTKERNQLSGTDKTFSLQLKWLLERRAANASTLGFLKERAKDAIWLISPVTGALLLEPSKSPLSSYEDKFLDIATKSPFPPHGCAEIFSDYVHDSFAGFDYEPTILTGGYLRYRHVFKEAIHAESQVYGWANQGLSHTKAATNAAIKFFSDLWDSGVATYTRARHRIAEIGHNAIQSASSTYHAAEQKVLRSYQEAERELYKQLAERYASVKGAIDEYNSPEARQRRQWDLEAQEYDRMRPR